MAPHKAKNLNSLYKVDARLETFLYLLNSFQQQRNDAGSENTFRGSRPSRKLTSLKSVPEGQPTSVPVPMASHILRLQGVSYLDTNVATIASLAADKFLATLLTQAVACRNHRLKGDDFMRAERAEHAKNAKERNERTVQHMKEQRVKKHKELEAKRDLVRAHKAWMLASRDKSKKKKQPISALQNTMMNAFETVRSLERASDRDSALDSKGSKKGEASVAGEGGVDDKTELEEDLDEDHLYFHSDGSGKEEIGEMGGEDDEGDVRFCLQVRDVVNPLSAWGMNVTGKTGVASPAGLTNVRGGLRGPYSAEALWHARKHESESPDADITHADLMIESKASVKTQDAPHSVAKSSGTKKVKAKGSK